MSRLKAGLDAEELLTKESGGVGSNLRTFHPLFLAIGLDGLVGSTGVTWEEVCTDKTAKESD